MNLKRLVLMGISVTLPLKVGNMILCVALKALQPPIARKYGEKE